MAANVSVDIFGGSTYSIPQSRAPYSAGVSALVGLLGSAISSSCIGANLLLLAAVAGSEHLRSKPGTQLVASLGVADLLVGLIMLPQTVHGDMHNWLIRPGCLYWLMYSYLDFLLCFASMLLLTAVTADRYVYIRRPLRYASILTPPLLTVINITCWALGAASMAVMAWAAPPDPVTCKLRVGDTLPEMMALFLSFYSLALLLFYIPAIAVIVLTCRLFILSLGMVRHDQQVRRLMTATRVAPAARDTPISDERRQLVHKAVRIARQLVILNFTYIAMWLPYFLYRMFFYHTWPYAVNRASMWLAYSNSALNPLLWLLTADYRRAYKRVLRRIANLCLGCIGKEPLLDNTADRNSTIAITTHS